MADLWDGTLAAIIGGIAGGFAGVFVTTYTNKTNRTATRIEKRLDDIEASVELLRTEAIAYWSSSASGDEVTSRKIVALWEAIVTRVDGLGAFSSQVGDLTEVNASIDLIYDLVTGDSFQAKARSADENKVHQIRQVCNALCNQVHSSRTLVRRWRHFWKRWQSK